MNYRIYVAAFLLFSSSLVIAASSVIGTATVHGEMTVDGYAARGNATLFEGSVVQTGSVGATLRLNNGAQIELATGSRGTFLQNRFVLQQGQTELTASAPFQLDAQGLRVAPSTPDSKGFITVAGKDAVEVAAISGALQVTNSHGVLLAEVAPGTLMSFAVAAAGTPAQATTTPPPPTITDFGSVSTADGHYYLTSLVSGTKYEITGANVGKYVGKNLRIQGAVLQGTAEHPAIVSVSSLTVYGSVGAGLTGGGVALVAVGTAGAIAGTAYALAVSR